MQTRIIRYSDVSASKWSGGETYEYYIYPENAVYKERNFKLRISMAKAFVEKSTYTELPGVLRYLVSLENTAKIVHNQTREVTLSPFGFVDKFRGDEHTTADGAIKDFNLMLKDISGSMEIVHSGHFSLNDCNFIALYFEKGGNVSVCDDVINTECGDMLIITEFDNISFSVSSEYPIILCKATL